MVFLFKIMIKTQILLGHGELGKLASFCGCSTKYAKQCLEGLYTTDKADIVRANAIKFFNGVKRKVKVNESART